MKGNKLNRVKNVSRIKRAETHIRENYSRGILVDELAQLACMSRFHFAREFKAITGITPMQHICKARVECVKLKLLTANLSLAAVSDICGFASQSHMSRVFKAATGETPAAYKALALSRRE